MDRCLNHEAALERVQAKVEQTEDELGQLHKWKSTMEKKFDLSEQARKELEQRTEEAGKALEAKNKEVQDLKEKLCQAKEVVVREYRDSDALLRELGGSFLQGFDDALCQLKKAYPKLDICPSLQRIQTTSLVMMRFRVTENQPHRRMSTMPTQNSRLILPISFVFYFENNPSFIFVLNSCPLGLLSVINALFYFYAF